MLTLHLIIYDHWEQLPLSSKITWMVKGPPLSPWQASFPEAIPHNMSSVTLRNHFRKKRGTFQQEIMNAVKEKDKDLLAMEISSSSHVPFALEHFLLLMTVCVVSLKNQLNELLTQAMFRFLLIHLKIWEAFPPFWVVPHPYTQPTLSVNFTPDFGMHAGVYT